jgi:Ran GTPase-activating protein (RanGAP) involved in mRNA processing and transport
MLPLLGVFSKVCVAIQPYSSFDLRRCELEDRGISNLATALAIWSASVVKLVVSWNKITSVGIRTLADDSVEAVKTLTKLCLMGNLLKSEGATILPDALGRNATPGLKQLHLDYCHIDDDGFVTLVSALEQSAPLCTFST